MAMDWKISISVVRKTRKVSCIFRMPEENSLKNPRTFLKHSHHLKMWQFCFLMLIKMVTMTCSLEPVVIIQEQEAGNCSIVCTSIMVKEISILIQELFQTTI